MRKVKTPFDYPEDIEIQDHREAEIWIWRRTTGYYFLLGFVAGELPHIDIPRNWEFV